MSWESGQTFWKSLAWAKSGQEEKRIRRVTVLYFAMLYERSWRPCWRRDGQGWSPRVEGMEASFASGRVDVAPSVYNRDKDGPIIMLSMHAGY